jgi:hypothetical protein
MRRNYAQRALLAGGISLLCLFPLGPASVGDGAENLDRCEIEARQAYWQALKICQLAENPNPRLRCFEAAKAVYWHTLQECHKGSGSKPLPVEP